MSRKYSTYARKCSTSPAMALSYRDGGTVMNSRLVDRRNIQRRLCWPLRKNELHMALPDLVLRHPASLHRLGYDQRRSTRLQLPGPSCCAFYQAVFVKHRVLDRHV